MQKANDVGFGKKPYSESVDPHDRRNQARTFPRRKRGDTFRTLGATSCVSDDADCRALLHD